MKTFIERHLAPQAQALAKQYRVLTITGARQSGKSTFAQRYFPDKPYTNLEALDVRQAAQADPRAFLRRFPDGAIIDEIQHCPDLLSYIQVIVDEHDKPGMFILTGSQNFAMNQAITQSLAGRTAMLTLYPLSIREIIDAGYDKSTTEFLTSGFYPDVIRSSLNPAEYYGYYLNTYVERDVRQLINIQDLSRFERFVRVLASRVGQLVNLQSISRELGISAPTINQWISLLEASYVVKRLQPYYQNIGKRQIKSPKLYFTDVGLAAYLLGIHNPQQMETHPLKGQLFENMVVMDLIKTNENYLYHRGFYFYRDNLDHEIDVLIEKENRQLLPIEIKSSETFSPNFSKELANFHKTAQWEVEKGYVVYNGQLPSEVDGHRYINYRDAGEILSDNPQPTE